MPTTYEDPVMLDSTGQDIADKLNTIAGLMGSGVIDDTSTASDKTWSASKINTQLGTKANADLVPSGASTSNKLATASDVKDVYNANAKTGASNWWELENVNSQGTGVTFTLNDDKTVSLSAGTTTSECYFPEGGGASIKNLLPSEDYVVSYGKNAIANLQIQVLCKETSSSSWSTLASESSKPYCAFTTPASYYVIWIRLLIANNKTVAASTLYPMIKLALDIGDTFDVYAMTNRELTEKVGTLSSHFYTKLGESGETEITITVNTNYTQLYVGAYASGARRAYLISHYANTSTEMDTIMTAGTTGSEVTATHIGEKSFKLTIPSWWGLTIVSPEPFTVS